MDIKDAGIDQLVLAIAERLAKINHKQLQPRIAKEEVLVAMINENYRVQQLLMMAMAKDPMGISRAD